MLLCVCFDILTYSGAVLWSHLWSTWTTTSIWSYTGTVQNSVRHWLLNLWLV